MAVHVHRAHRTDALADELARMLAEPSQDPFAEEVVVVPARGVERWLTQRLSHRLGGSPGRDDGVCAGVRFLSPRSLVAMLTGTERTDAWDADRLVWPLLATIDAGLDEPWARTLAVHLGHLPQTPEEKDDTPLLEQRRDRRYAVARRLAGLLSRYAVQRPAMLTAWRDGRAEDGHGHPLDGDLLWQPELYRRLVDRLGSQPPDERHAAVVAAVRSGAPLALPDRLSLFGHTRLPVTEVELLAAVGSVREVHLWLPQASDALWRRLAPRVRTGPVERAEDRGDTDVGHPLLASLGRDARELQRSLALLGAITDEAVADAEPSEPDTLLGWLQHDLRADAEPDAAVRAARRRREGDDSVQVHACHGAERQVDVLREVLVGLLQDDETLQPRDVLVMCPDIEEYAPLLEAGFGLADVVEGGHPAHGLRVRLADRGLARTNPLLDLAARVLHLAGGRATANEILDLAGTDVVRRRFRLSDDDLSQLALWVQQTNIRWGLAADLRAPYGLARLPHNTWQLGLDRLLLGVAVAEEGQRRFADTLPLDDVGSAAVALAGRMAELVDRVETAVRAVSVASSAQDFLTALSDAVDGLGDVPPDDAWQRAQVARELAAVADAAAGLDVPVRPADVRTLLDQRTQGRPTRASFRTGALTVATMVPMRSVPHRVIALVGLDDGRYPRIAGVDGDDVLARRARTGERDVRAEDRQLLLDAVLAATERLVITYSGADEVTGGSRPPAVPVGELLDALDITTAAPLRECLVVRHPLQPFDARNFRPGELVASGAPVPFSFDTAAHDGAVAARGDRSPVPPFVAGALPAPDDVGDTVLLADLHAFLAHPVRAFVRQRVGVSLPWDEDEPLDAIPVELDALQAWAIGDRLLRLVLAGADLDDAERAERSRGTLPPFALGTRMLDQVHGKVSQLLDAAAGSLGTPPDTVDVAVDLPARPGASRRLTGQVPDVRGERVVRVGYSRLGPKQRLAGWLDVLALTAERPDVAWQVETIGSGGRQGPQRSLLGPVAPERALAVLADLVDLRDRGLREPLPLPLKTAHAWAETPGTDENRAWQANRQWFPSSYGAAGERDDDYHRLVWGEDLPLRPDATAPVEQRRALLEAARGDEAWNNQGTRLGQYALRLWSPLTDHERVGPA